MRLTDYNITNQLSKFVSDANYYILPPDVIYRTKMCILDWIGSAYSGKGSPSDEIIYNFIRETGGKKSSTLVGSVYSGSPIMASLYNGMISAVMEIDDVHEEVMLHPSIGIIPATLATGEYIRASGKEVISSIVIGYDISVRITRAVGMTHYYYWHSTGTCNTFGAAAASGKLLNLDSKRLTMALGLAGTQASGLCESIFTEATMTKHLHSGKAASNGIFSAFLARDGFKGSDSIIEGNRGFLASSTKATDEDIIKIIKDFGKPFLIMKNFFKKYACCRGCFEGIEGVYNILKSNNLNIQDIEKINVTMEPNRVWRVGNKNPNDIYGAKFSLPFCIALIAIYGKAGLYQFNERNLNDPLVLNFMRKVKLLPDPAIITKARVEVICKDKSVLVTEPICKSLNLQEVKEKFVENMSPVLEEKHINDILSYMENLDKIEDIKEFTRILKHKPKRRI